MLKTMSLLWCCFALAGAIELEAASSSKRHPAAKDVAVVGTLSHRLQRVKYFEAEMEKLAQRKIPSKVPVDFPVDAEALSKEADGLISKFGETMEFYNLRYSMRGVDHGLWTCLGLKSGNGDMCDDTTVEYPGHYNSTSAWNEATQIQKLLKPVEFALRRVRFSIMHPSTLVAWHCDNCPREQMAPEGCPGHVDEGRLRKKWKNKFHEWVRLHVMLTNNADVEFGIGGNKVKGTQNGAFYLANVAMPHRVDNKGTGTRTALLMDIRIKGNKQRLRESELGRSILQAWKTVRDADGSETYLSMGKEMYRYLCGMGAFERYETEWHSQAYSKPLYRPLPPFEPKMFNVENDGTAVGPWKRCGILGDPKHKKKLERVTTELGPQQQPLLAQMSTATRRRRRTAQ
jgi:hypothetical protein